MSICSLGRSVLAGTMLLLVGTTYSSAACIPRELKPPAPQDAVVRALAAQSACPKSAAEFTDALKRLGARMEPTLVNFAGFHSPEAGGFFIFEIVSSAGSPPSNFKVERGDLLVGHFANATNGRLVSQNSGLTIELIAWDSGKQFFNFYELVDGTWFYRGDSKDILDDVRLLHRQRNGSTNPFGRGLRCAGCHINGALLKKELTPPHHAWFRQDRPLRMDTLKPDAFISGRLADKVDASELSKLVVASARRLATSPGYRKVLETRNSMQEQLRPLFCPMEVNIESDAAPFGDQKPTLQIPSAFFVDSRLATAAISVKRDHYVAALQKLHSHLPKTTPRREDADHGWLTPVKAHSDIALVDALIEAGVVDNEFATAVLAIDFANPAFSKTRCDLLKLVPDRPGPDFVARFRDALRGTSVPGAAELLDNLPNPARNAAFHRQRAQAFLSSCQQHSSEPEMVLNWVRLLAQRRIEVSTSEISQKPVGFHILEDPGRVVFPSTEPPARPRGLTLTPTCQVQ